THRFVMPSLRDHGRDACAVPFVVVMLEQVGKGSHTLFAKPIPCFQNLNLRGEVEFGREFVGCGASCFVNRWLWIWRRKRVDKRANAVWLLCATRKPQIRKAG